jgi:DNA-binding PadR family transcriptional regulator
MGRSLLTDLELMVLLAVMRLGDEAYGVTVTREIEKTTGRNVAVAVVYATLDRLQERGLVTSFVGDPTPARGGRAKRYFRATSRGIRQARDTRNALSALWAGVRELRGGEA